MPNDDAASFAADGSARFREEKWEEAARLYEEAHQRDPEDARWPAMRDRAEANVVARPDHYIPSHRLFDADELVAPPPAPNDPPTDPPHVPRGLFGQLGDFAGRLLGLFGDLIFEPLVAWHGERWGYKTGLWTNWYKRGEPRDILTLAYMRDLLNQRNLLSSYPKGELVGFQKPSLKPPAGVEFFRTADGSWNNLENPKEGAAGTRFPRNVRNQAIEAEKNGDLLDPNPRKVSRELLTRGREMQEVPFLNMLGAIWIQFQNHDWVTHGDNLKPCPDHDYKLKLDPDDPIRLKTGQTEMRVARTQPDPTRRPGDTTPVTFINEVTHWWDGSQIYGSDQATQDRLRSHADGKMLLTDGDRLPVGKDGVEDSGMVRNWWVGLSAMHLLFVKEHNAICDALKGRYPEWDDNRLFNVARLINAAVMAKIHSVEWTPAILPNQTLDKALNANWFGLLTHRLRKPNKRKTKAFINIRQPEIGGVVGNPIEKHDSPYGLAEEFVEIYRLHSLLPEMLEIRDLARDSEGEPVEKIPFAASRLSGSPKITKRMPMPDLLFSFGVQHPGQLVLNNYPAFMQELSVPRLATLDLGAVDILRARERGIPRYNAFREELGLNRIASFGDLTRDGHVVKKLESVYGEGPKGVEKLDLLIGTLAEDPENRPTYFGFGETMFQIFILNATRRLQADRFYTDNYNEQTYTKLGMDWIDDVTLKKVLIRHYPELAETGLRNVENAFEPWDDDPAKVKDLGRHPLNRSRSR